MRFPPPTLTTKSLAVWSASANRSGAHSEQTLTSSSNHGKDGIAKGCSIYDRRTAGRHGDSCLVDEPARPCNELAAGKHEPGAGCKDCYRSNRFGAADRLDTKLHDRGAFDQ